MFFYFVIYADVCTVYEPVPRQDGDFVYYDAAELPEATSGSGSKEPSRVRVEFPETWLWSETSTGYHLMPAVACCLLVAAADSLQCALVSLCMYLSVY